MHIVPFVKYKELFHTWLNKWFWIFWYVLYMKGSCWQYLHLGWPKEIQTRTLLNVKQQHVLTFIKMFLSHVSRIQITATLYK